MIITGTTRIVGIFGDPVAHSRSPLMQNAALQAAGIDAVYVPFHVTGTRLNDAIGAVRTLGLAGVNLTIPHKEAAVALLDELDPAAALIGAVNTVVNRNGRLVGYNTDGQGLLAALQTELGVAVAGRRVVLLGAGGAARAAVVALAGAGAAWIGMANRTAARAEHLLGELAAHFPGTTFAPLPWEATALAAAVAPGVDLLVNSTAIGLHGERCPFRPEALLGPGGAVYDMVYSQEATPLVAAARAAGLAAADGLGMLAGQGEAAFGLWFGCPPPQGVMRTVLMTADLGK